jgi:hypothetical protein
MYSTQIYKRIWDSSVGSYIFSGLYPEDVNKREGRCPQDALEVVTYTRVKPWTELLLFLDKRVDWNLSNGAPQYVTTYS